MSRPMTKLLQVLVFVAFGVIWQLASGTLVDPFLISSPTRVFSVLVNDLQTARFYNDLYITFAELVLGFAAGATLGVLTAVIFGRWPILARIFNPFLVALNSIPRIALAPLIIIWFGIDMMSKVVVAATLVYFLTFLNSLAGIQSADPRLINIGRVVGASEWQIFRKIVLPGAVAWIMTGLRTALPFALVGVIVGEFLAASAGLGYRLNLYATSYNAGGTMAMIIVMMALLMALNAIAEAIEAWLLRWQPKSNLRPEKA